jgi:hypothetical protein
VSIRYITFLFIFMMILVAQGCTSTSSNMVETISNTKTITIYDNKIIPPNCGISTGTYTKIDGYRYVNIAVEFEQKEAEEEPLSLGVVFAHSSSGKLGARRYFTFDRNFTSPADPQMITISGKSSWHGHPHDKSSYIARLPIMGPFIQVFPFNHHDEERKFSVSLYLTN